MKRAEQRGTFGRWLVTSRKERGLTPDVVRERIREQRGFAMAHSTYAMLESGSRQPTDEQRAHLVAFFGTEPEPEPQPASAADAVLAAIADQTVWLRRQWEATTALTATLGALVQAMEHGRLEEQERAEAMARLLGEQTRALQSLVQPSSTQDEVEQPPNRARRAAGR